MKKPRFAPRPALLKQIIDRLITQSIRARKPGWFRTDSGTSYRLSKSVPPCPAERHYQSPSSMPKSHFVVNSDSRGFSAFSTGFLKPSKTALSDNYLWSAHRSALLRRGQKEARAVLHRSGPDCARVRDFSKLGPLLEDSVEDGITDFRSLTYSLGDEEAARQNCGSHSYALGDGACQSRPRTEGPE